MNTLLKEITDNNILLKVEKGELKVFTNGTAISEDLVARIRARKKELIEFVLSNTQQETNESFITHIPAIPAQSSYPLSAAQRRVWVLSQLEEGSIAYNITGAYVLSGSLDSNSLERAFNTLIARHEILRTVFCEDEQGEVRQYILPSIDFKVHYQDHVAAADTLLVADFNHAFDLASGPLLRARLYQLSAGKWLFSFVIHHIISDGWSIGVFIQELLHVYNGGGTLPPLRIQYKDYADWQAAQLSGAALEAHRAYWLDKFKGELPVLDLVTDKVRPLIKNYSGAKVERQLSINLSRQLKQLVNAAGSTLFMGLLAAVKTLLYRYTGQEDIIIGTAVAGREQMELEQQIGFYVNTLALRSRFNGSDSFDSLLSMIHQQTLEAYAHQVYPFDSLIDELRLHRDMSRHPLFDVFVVFHNEIEEQHTGSLSITPFKDDIHITCKFDLQFDFTEDEDSIQVSVTYSPDIFQAPRIERLVAHFEQLLSAVVAAPATPLRKLNYLLPGEREQLVYGFNDTNHLFPADKTIIDLFREQVLIRPDHPAVKYNDTSLSYSQLDGITNQVGAYLRKEYGISAGDLVGVQLERSEWQLICLIGVLKAGGAYVPIDPAFPEERRQYIVSDSKCKVVLTAAALAQLQAALPAYSTEAFTAGTTSRDLMYVLYTSGSTGRPKGCMLEYRGVVNRLNWMWREYSLGSNDIILQKTSFTFDVSVWEIFLPLCVGATEVLCPAEDVASPGRLLSLISREAVTCLHFVPSMLNSFLGSVVDAALLKSVRMVIASGEALTPATVELWYELVNIPLHNLYGPTEASIDVSYYATRAEEVIIPIGRPIWNTQLYILGADNEVLPTSVRGEICIGGDGLARGYLNNAALTEEKFTTDPFISDGRLYHTGDIGYRTANGLIVYAGRKDDQVKVRGYRIELGEIVHALQQYEDIHEATVIARKGNDGENELIAYVTGREVLEWNKIRTYLSAILPAYMVPAYFMQLDAMPLNASGKTDRKALPVPDSFSLSQYMGARTATEAALVAIWSDILGISKEKISVNDNFFLLGGHSLKATRLLSLFYRTFDVKLSLKDIFNHPLLEDQAGLVDTGIHTIFEHIPAAVPQESYTLSSAQRRLWILSQLEGGNVAYNVPAAYEFNGPLDVARLEGAFNALIARHEILRTVFPEAEEVRQFILPGIDFSIKKIDLRGTTTDVDRLLKHDFLAPFDLACGPLLRATLYQLTDQQWILGFVMHHIISDGVSVVILVNELLELYKGNNDLPALRIQYKDYSEWQSQHLQEADRLYWHEQLSGELPVLELSGAKSRPGIKTYAGGIVSGFLGSDQTDQLRQLLHEQHATLFMGLLASVNVLLYKYSGQEDIIIGSQIAGREHADLEGQLGNYLNTLALRSRFTGKDSFLSLLSNTRQLTLDAYAHQSYPFDALLDELVLQRDSGRHPLFDVSVVLQNMESLSPVIGELSINSYDAAAETISKFDLAFNFTESDGGIRADLVYNSDIYDRHTATRLLHHFEQLLLSVIAAPATTLWQLDYIGANEREQLLTTFNHTTVPYPRDSSLAAVFSAQARQTPDKVAIIYGTQVYTYKELDERSSRLGHYLREEYGIGRNDLVGIMADRSADLLVAILGILKAGGAYVPIDPSYPDTRKSFMLEDTGARVLITQSDYLFSLDYYTGHIFALDIQLENLTTPVTTPAEVNAATDLAYVMYTSGSTGHPKGVLVTQRSVLRLVIPCNYVPLSGDETLLCTGSLSFDATTFEYWSMLLSGGRLVMISRDTLLDASLLADEIQGKGVNTMWFTAGWLHELIDSNLSVFQGLQTVVAGGDKLSGPHIARLREVYPALHIVNGYGPTENTTFSLTYEIGNATDIIPIGYPISNSRAYILDNAGQLCGIGVRGEICVGGDGVAIGYLNQASLTAEKFISSPFVEGDRLYRTGDTGYWQADGAIIFTGRRDDQVKIRGFRVETGEIEHALEKHEAINAAVVTVYEQELAAYITSDTTLNIPALSAWLGSQLPVYMLPSYYIQLESLPLTANGKVDRRQLPSPEVATATMYVAPRNETEQQLADIWSELLGLNREKISVKDNFFLSGGHSLRAIRLTSQLYKTFEVKISLKDIFENPVLEDQALLLRASGQTSYVPIPLAELQESYVLSSSQRRLWILSQLEDGNVAYNVPAAYEFNGPLDVARLEGAFNALITRHEILRTVFPEAEEVRQFILPGIDFSIKKIDLRGTTTDVDRLLKHDFLAPFDLACGPLLRATLYQLTDQQWILGFVMHHIISDGVSVVILVNELLELYKGNNDLPALRIQYKDYSEWQSQHLQEADRLYWHEQLSGELPVLELSGAKSRPGIKTYAGGIVSGFLGSDQTDQLRQLLHEQHATLFMGLLASVNVLLYKYSGQEDIIIGSQIAGREHADLEGQLGNYLNTLALRSRFTGKDSFLSLLSNTRQLTLDAYAHQSYPFDALLDELVLQRDSGRHPLFDVSVVLQNMESLSPVIGELSINSYDAAAETISKFDLAFNFTESDGGIRADLVYNSDIYDRHTATRLLHHFEQLLLSVIAAPATTLWQLDYIGANEREQLLTTFNHTTVPYPRDSSLAAVFSAQARQTPDKVAIIYGTQVYTYKELDERSSRLGHYLREEYGIGRNDLVGIMADRSADLLVAILGILKAGGAYVPIDPSYPDTRKSFMLEDTGARVLITQSDYLFSLDYYTGHIFALDIQLENLTTPVTTPAEVNAATDLAYVMYTSGSTGHPKGVLVTQRSVLRLVIPCNYVPLSGDETLLCTGSLSFDATTFEYWSMLLSGGRLVMISRDTLLDASLLADEIQGKGVNTMWFTAGWLHELIDSNLSVFQGLQTVVAGGDKLSGPHIARLREAYPALHIVNGYGPTENTTFSLTYEIGNATDIIPIGYPISNSRAYILDNAGQLCGIGVRGEICVGGDGVAIGYLNQASLTAEKFISSPFVEGDRLYRTGDTGYWQADGAIIFTGRRDDQVKIRGFRVETGEIEHALEKHEAINAAVVTVYEQELAAYITSDTTLNIPALSAWLGSQLPVYMLPSYYIQLESLPLTANGKVDRRQLPSPEVATATMYVAPRNETEQQLADIWSELLGLNREKISVKDNFFLSGGHSLRAIRLTSQLYKTFEVKISLKDIFENPVLEDQALLLRASGQTSYVPIPLAELQESYVLSSSQRRLWILSQLEDGNVAYNVPGAYVFEGNVDKERLEESITRLIARHEILRTIFLESEGDETRQLILPAYAFNLSYIDLRDQPDRVSDLLEQDSTHVFNLTRGPLLKAGLYQLSDHQWIFSYVMHHIISDAVSMEILITELLEYYKGNETLPALRIQYKDYATWQYQLLTSEDHQQDRNYWLNRFAGSLPTLELLSDRPRPSVKTYNGSVINKTLNRYTNKGFRKLLSQQDATLFMGLLATVNTLLYRYSGQEDIIVGFPVVGREHPDLNGQIGFYVNTLALRSQFSGEDSFIALLSATRQLTLDAYAHQRYPFDQLVEDLQMKRDMSRYPLFDVALSLLSESRQMENSGIDHLKIYPYKSDTTVTSKFDLQFTFSESAEDLHLTLLYNTDLYDAGMANYLVEHLEQLLNAIIASPETALSKLDYISANERKKLLFGFNDTAAVYPRDSTVMQVFEEQVLRTPSKAAVIFEDTVWTYTALNEITNQLAHYLRHSAGIQPGDSVGLILDRSDKLMIAILGILKAGGAYVPVTPDYPSERIDFMLTDSHCRLVFDEQAWHNFYSIRNDYSRANPTPVNTATDLAYIMYTSGSTGQPKGVMIEHRGILRLIIPCNYVPLTGNEVLLSTGSISFDATTFEYWSMLLTGGTLIFAPKEVLLDASLLGATIRAKGVDTMWFTCGWLYELIDKDITVFENLKAIISGGDRASLAHLYKLYDTYPALQIIHAYGPTENTTFSLMYPISGKPDVLPIGKPLNNDSVFILDKNLQQCGIGVAGEICLSGDGLARGYLNHPELTAEKFVPNPFRDGELMYRSGDIGRWLPDGNIVFVGRKDNQVKIRGFRIETGEIEHALHKIPAIISAAVAVHPGINDEKELVAYVVSDDTLNASYLLTHLEKMLPAYMMPAHYVQLASLPLNANGKLDRKMLPAPAGIGLETGIDYVAPRNAAEQCLVDIWHKVLGKERISVKDNFFESGGDSVKATRVVSQLYRDANIKIGLKEIFTRPVLEDLAIVLTTTSATAFTGISPVPVQQGYALSAAQRRIWIMSRIEAASVAYNVAGAYEFKGKLDMQALEHSLTTLGERHEVLRTVFREVTPGNVQQVILPQSSIRVAYTDLTGADSRLHELIQQDFFRPFSLADGPLLRAAVYKVADDKWIFNYVMHHIISDGRSLNVLIRELLHLYNGGEALTPLRIQYKDYAAWQVQQLTGEHLQAHRSYWLQQFEGELPILGIAGDKPRPVVKTYNGGGVHKIFHADIAGKLLPFLQQHNATLYMGLLAAVNALIYRYTGQEDIIIGSPVAGREHIDLESQIGFYVNTIALRSRFNGEESYLSLLEKVRQQTIDAYSHQVYPFDELIEQLKLQRDISRHPLFDVSVVLQEHTGDAQQQQLQALEVTEYSEGNKYTSKYDLAFDFMTTGETIHARLIYNSDIFFSDTATRILDHLEQLLLAILTAPATPLDKLSYLSVSAQEEVLHTFNSSSVQYPADKTVAALFAEQAARTPDQPALVAGDISLTYAELNSQANQLAHYLINTYQLLPNDLVAISFERGEKMIIALLAVLKAGAAYIPIDVDYPAERISYMLSDSGSKVLIDKTALERFSRVQDAWSVENPVISTTPDDLAYCIYTSGSTGKPKGVLISHHALVDYSYAIRSRTNIDSCQTFGLVSTIAADLGNTIIYTSLLIGGCLHVFSTADVISTEKMSANRLDCLKIVPSHFASLQRKGKLFAPTKCLIFGGEKLTADVLDIIKTGAGSCEVYNHYGPSETTIGKLVNRIDLSSYDSIPLGRPFGNNYVYLLDNHLQPVPVGVPGEICIGGSGLAKGYLHQPLLTAEKFVADPFKQGRRIYKTGDLGRWQPDGNILFLGRKDEQIKIRGFRIEPGEIEQVIQQYPGIAQALVIPDRNNLIGYVAGSANIDIAALRTWLLGRLPAYMIPTWLMPLEKLPITLNGKIDKKALPSPDYDAQRQRSTYVGSRNQTEQDLVIIWGDVLGLDTEKIGVNDSFFELGGHSIAAIKVMWKIHEQFGIEPDMTAFFNSPDIATVAAEIQNILWMKASTDTPASKVTTII
ncbi:non-ribosomal peptide synthase/polyketide synthase [Chitinophaga sancti]|uniref:non-ribosomal peptide synthetase n=1 Tax=Chitinophaga sancti TaxID=1004 RepID=UPI002A75A5AB|nr:non-ribosomal peptide synthase/polyketide synthase [Chitinophaga sancti]WPQ62325.1 non-ribosomal peptide synthase/polyketide synthase [Chitinophaga sancti]